MKKNLFRFIIGILFSAGVLIYIISANGLGKLKQQLFMLNPYWIVLAIFSMTVYWLLEAGVLHIITHSLHANQRFRDSFLITMIGQFFNSITPFASGGQPAQVYTLTKNGINTGVAGSILTIKFIIYQSVLTIFSIIIIIFKIGFFSARLPSFTKMAALGFAVNTSVIVFLLVLSSYMNVTHVVLVFISKGLKRLKLIKNTDKTIKDIENQLILFHDNSLALRKNFLLIIKTSILTIAQLISFFIIPYFIYRGFGLSTASMSNIVAAKVFVVMITSFIPIPGASGGAEGSFYLFFSLFFSKDVIVAALLLWRLITFYFSLMVGGIFTLYFFIKTDSKKGLSI